MVDNAARCELKTELTQPFPFSSFWQGNCSTTDDGGFVYNDVGQKEKRQTEKTTFSYNVSTPIICIINDLTSALTFLQIYLWGAINNIVIMALLCLRRYSAPSRLAKISLPSSVPLIFWNKDTQSNITMWLCWIWNLRILDMTCSYNENNCGLSSLRKFVSWQWLCWSIDRDWNVFWFLILSLTEHTYVSHHSKSMLL